MKFLFFAVPLLSFGAYAASNATQIEADIASIASQVKALQYDTQQVVAGPASIAFALQVELDAVQVKAAVLQATQNANQSPVLDNQSSLTVGLDLLNLSNVVKSSLQTVTNRAAQFGELSPVVLYSLYDLRKTTDIYGAAITKKLAALEKGIAPSITNGIDAAFAKAIAAYGGAKS